MTSLGPWAYLLIFLLALLETAAFIGFLIPGETIVIFSGFLVSQQVFDLKFCLIATALGAIFGDSIGYEIGRRLDRGIFEKRERFFLIKRSHLEKVQSYYEIHGGKTIFFGRFSGFLRAFAPLVAGMSKMPYRKFLIYNITGGVLWTFIFTYLGFYFGSKWRLVEEWARKAGLYFFVSLFLVTLAVYLVRRRAASRAARSAAGLKA
jgi:membrane protein DedA with SNARE-associated domain